MLPIVCGAYRLTPAQAADQTPAELQMMLDGLDWVSDRQWERALFLRASDESAQQLLDVSYPTYQVDPARRVVRSVASGRRDKPKRRSGAR